MAKPRKPKANETKEINKFVEALKFISLVTKDNGNPNETHVYLNNKYATAFNGSVSIGTKIEEDLFACPNNKLLIEALSKCGQHISITQLDNNRLSIKSDKFKAIIPCIDPNLITLSIPDEPCASIDNKFKMALEAVGVLADEDSNRVVTASILMANGSLISTNGHIIFEYWHGISLPTNISLPKALVKPLTGTNKNLTKFGFSQSSVTFYFDDESWIKSQLYADQWPDVSMILNKQSNAWPVPTDLFIALSAVMPFCEDNWVYFHAGVLRSHPIEGVGATFEIAGLPSGPILNGKALGLLKPWAKQIDFLAPGPHPGTSMVMAFGDNMRAALMGRG